MTKPLEQLRRARDEAERELTAARDSAALEQWRVKYLGRNGKLKELSNQLPALAPEERKTIGRELNEAKGALTQLLAQATAGLHGRSGEEDILDFSRPGTRHQLGHRHPLLRDVQDMKRIFLSLGFDVYDGNEIVSEWENFDSLNMPESHPARDMWDTLWIDAKASGGVSRKTPNGKLSSALLLRTHTSAHQVDYLLNHPLPAYVVIPGKTFRHEATDRRHEMQFYQLEGIAVDKAIHLGHLEGVIREFFSKFFRKELNIYFRPGYFPFTEPSIEIDLDCIFCDKKGCSICNHSGVLEVGGAGMIHPAVLRNANIDPKEYQGFAFGMGPNRLSMLKHNINDIRLFASGLNQKFLEQF